MSDSSGRLPPRHRRRFIAGAVCPRCGAMDRIVVDADTDLRSCVACGFSDERPSASPMKEPPTRVTRAAARLRDTEAQPVSLVDTRAGTDTSRSDSSD